MPALHQLIRTNSCYTQCHIYTRCAVLPCFCPPAPPLQRDPRVVELKRASWQEALEEGAARRGLEADRAAVLVAEMRDTPPAGVVGAQQVRGWLAAVLEQAAR